MRVQVALSLAVGLLALVALSTAAEAQGTAHVCRALGGDGRWHISGSVMVPPNALRRAERDFRASVSSSSGSARELWCSPLDGSSYSSYVDGLEQVLRGEDSASYSQESEASRRVVDARYRQQIERERASAAEQARLQAEYRAGVAESDRRQAEHRTAMAESARQQEAYRQARADWERRVASCRAGNHADCAPATPR
jgi:hypothetical protein